MNRAVFLDKDGTLIEDVPYNVDPGKMKFARGSEKGLQLLQSRGYKLIIISNQSGIARGYFTPEDMKKVEQALFEMARAIGVGLSGFYYCPHHPEGTVEKYALRCSCRKPEPGLIFQAAHDHDIDLKQSWFIGDILNDIEAGRRAGCRTILIDSGKETEWVLSRERLPHNIVSHFEEAAEIISLFSRHS